MGMTGKPREARMVYSRVSSSINLETSPSTFVELLTWVKTLRLKWRQNVNLSAVIDSRRIWQEFVAVAVPDEIIESVPCTR